MFGRKSKRRNWLEWHHNALSDVMARAARALSLATDIFCGLIDNMWLLYGASKYRLLRKMKKPGNSSYATDLSSQSIVLAIAMLGNRKKKQGFFSILFNATFVLAEKCLVPFLVCKRVRQRQENTQYQRIYDPHPLQNHYILKFSFHAQFWIPFSISFSTLILNAEFLSV